MKQDMGVDAVFDRVKRRLEMASGNDRKYERPMDWEEADVIIESLAALRAHNSDSAEPVACGEKPKALADAILSLAKDGGGTRDLSFNAGLLAALKAAEPLYLASPPAKEVRADIIAQTIWNEHLFHADALVFGDKMITPDMAMAERLADLIVRALTNRTPDDEVGNG